MFAHISENVDHCLPTTSMASKTKNPRFGDAEFQKVYEQAKKYVIENKVLRLYQMVDLRENYKTIIICNTWRIDRCIHSADIETFEWDYSKKYWQSNNSYEKWPFVNLLPIDKKIKKEAGSEDLARSIVYKALWRALDAAGFETLPKKSESNFERSALAQIFIGFYLYNKSKSKNFKIDIKSLSAPARALRKNLWVAIIDRPLLSAVCALRGWRNSVSLGDYLPYALRGEAVKRVALEHRNCLPLLSLIAPKHWSRQDLFARNTWVKNGRKNTLIDRQGFDKRRRLASFEKPASHRWLLVAPFTVVALYAQIPRSVGLENIAASDLPKRVPAIVLCALILSSNKFNRVVAKEYQRVIRGWVTHCCEIWKTENFALLRTELERLRYELTNILDWVNAEGIGQRLPRKNATWASIKRLSDEWHIQQTAPQTPRVREYEWQSLLGDFEINDFKVRALTTSKELFEEGVVMHHCVAQYDAACYAGHYRIFSLSRDNGLRSTLNIENIGENTWRVEQLQSFCNGPVSKESQLIGKQIAQKYTDLCIAKAKEVISHEMV